MKVVARRSGRAGAYGLGYARKRRLFPEDGVTHFDAFEDMAMMTGIDISESTRATGCWEITAHYENPERTESQTLSFVVSIP